MLDKDIEHNKGPMSDVGDARAIADRLPSEPTGFSEGFALYLSSEERRRNYRMACQLVSPKFGKQSCSFLESHQKMVRATESDVARCICSFEDNITSLGSGEATLWFSRMVLAALGETNELMVSQKLTIEGLCKAIAEKRPFPGMLWVDFVQKWLVVPDKVRATLKVCLEEISWLALRLQQAMARDVSKLEPFIKKPILVLGNSANVASALSGLPPRFQKGLEVVSIPDDLAQQMVFVHKHTQKPLGKVLTEVRFEPGGRRSALDRLSSGGFGMVVVGCNAVALRPTNELEAIVSARHEEFLNAAAASGVPVCIAAGTYKLWPTLTYEKYRPSAVESTEYAIIPASHIILFTEDGSVEQSQIGQYYDPYFTSIGIPVAPMRYALESEKESYDFKKGHEDIYSGMLLKICDMRTIKQVAESGNEELWDSILTLLDDDVTLRKKRFGVDIVEELYRDNDVLPAELCLSRPEPGRTRDLMYERMRAILIHEYRRLHEVSMMEFVVGKLTYDDHIKRTEAYAKEAQWSYPR